MARFQVERPPLLYPLSTPLDPALPLSTPLDPSRPPVLWRVFSAGSEECGKTRHPLTPPTPQRSVEPARFTPARLIRYCEDNQDVVRLIRGQVPEASKPGRPKGKTGKNEDGTENSRNTRINKVGQTAERIIAQLKRDARACYTPTTVRTYMPHVGGAGAGPNIREIIEGGHAQG